MLRITFAALLLAIPQTGLAQTAAEQLQKGIFAEQAEGNLDNAIAIYRQLANSALPQRDVAAQAQYRLALALLQKGDMAGASGEFQRLAQNYADYRTLISGLAARASHAGMPAPVTTAVPVPKGPTFDHGAYVNASGKILQVVWVNPLSYVTIDAGGGQFYTFALAAPNALLRQEINRNTLQLEMMISVVGNLADDGQKVPVSITSPSGQKIEGSAVVARANAIVRLDDGKIVFDRQKLPPPGAQLPAEKK